MAPQGYEWKQIFGDEFNDNMVDLQKWGKCYYWYSQYYDGCANGNELQYYTGSQVSESGGSLRLTAEKRNVQGWNGTAEQTYNYTSGMLSTVRYNYESYTHVPFATTYGYFEARIKMPKGQGLWPAFWLLEEDQTSPPEIDIMEFLGHDPSTVYMNYHYIDNGNKQDQSTYTTTDFTQDWHTYAVNWEKGKITWYIDGIARKTFVGNQVTDKPMYILINLAVGGDWPGSPDGTTPFPSTMEVDYVRVYKLQATPITTTPLVGDTNTAKATTSSTNNTSGGQAQAPTTDTPSSDDSKTEPLQEQARLTDSSQNGSVTSQQQIPTPQVSKQLNRKYSYTVIAGGVGLLAFIGATVYVYRHRRLIKP